MDWVSKLDAQLYPILTSGSSSATVIRQDLEKRLETVLPEVRKAQNEIDDRIKNVKSLSEKCKYFWTSVLLLLVVHLWSFCWALSSISFSCCIVAAEEGQNEDGKDVLEKLTDLQGKLQTVLSDYQVLVQLLLSFFKNVSEVSMQFSTCCYFLLL